MSVLYTYNEYELTFLKRLSSDVYSYLRFLLPFVHAASSALPRADSQALASARCARVFVFAAITVVYFHENVCTNHIKGNKYRYVLDYRLVLSLRTSAYRFTSHVPPKYLLRHALTFRTRIHAFTVFNVTLRAASGAQERCVRILSTLPCLSHASVTRALEFATHTVYC